MGFAVSYGALPVGALCPSERSARRSALPVGALCPSERYNEKHRGRHKKLTVWARQMTRGQLRRWLPGGKLVVVGDSSFAALELLAAASDYAAMVTRLRLDAALYAQKFLRIPAPPRPPGKPGRPRKKGERLPKLEDRLSDPATAWQEVEATRGRGDVVVPTLR